VETAAERISVQFTARNLQICQKFHARAQDARATSIAVNCDFL